MEEGNTCNGIGLPELRGGSFWLTTTFDARSV
jgi:hypothetical protein